MHLTLRSLANVIQKGKKETNPERERKERPMKIIKSLMGEKTQALDGLMKFHS